ncbi:histidine kinase N-terminal 7TM domain-containing protein [Methanospirillum lacunae]|uniref:Histidine kinase domain-containing protein n=1 Tax=Methanospirillum lacunae TaxID=668570 RepID=A0A2V2NEE4_9EURY|nr:histidine kinase N-terminal 7TM domain-containing protein [Methanospirillum lacunae]PWR73971.1 hypothetical protein DK846_02055 [Methanospirillum lacunae]
MAFQNYPLFYLFFLSALITGYLSLYTWKRREIRSAKSFSILMGLISVWSLFYGFEVITDDPALHVLFLKLEYLAIPWISGFLILFALEFGGYTKYLTNKLLFLIFLIPVIVFIGYFTNDYHHLYYENSTFLLINDLVVISNTPGMLYRLLTVANIAAAIFGFLVVLQVYYHAPPLLRPQLKYTQLSFIVGIVCVLSYFVFPKLYPDFDLSPIFLVIIGVFLLHAIFRYKLLDLMYIPYRNIFSYLHEGVMVLDPKNRILEINEAASLFFDQDQEILRGRNLESIDSPLKEYYPALTGNDGTKFTIHKKKDQTEYFFLVEMYPVYNLKEMITCRMVILHDISDITKSNKALEEAGKKLSLLNCITRHDLLNQIAIVSGYSNVMIDSSYNPDLYKHHLEIIRDSSDMMKDLIQFTAAYQNLGVGSPVWLSVEGLATRAWKSLPNADGISLEVRSSVEIFADLLLEKVFFNLFDNSIRHGGEIHKISIFSYEQNGIHFLVYEDDGMGIEPEIKPKIFSRGFGKNTGYGLFLIREILSITSITINETGIYGKGVRFEMKIPAGGVRKRSDNSGSEEREEK